MHVFERQDERLTLFGCFSILPNDPRTGRMNILLSITLTLIFLTGIALALPFFVDLGQYQDHFKPVIEKVLNRKIQFESIHLMIWPRLGMRVDGFAILDDPSFNPARLASLNSLDVGVKFLPLLSGRIDVEEITLHDPVITIVRRKDGVLNLSTLGPASSPSTELPTTEAQPMHDPLQLLGLFAVERVTISGGELVYRDESAEPPAELRMEGLELLTRSVRLGQTPTVHLTGTLQPQNLSVQLDGDFGPLVETLDVHHFDFTASIGKLRLAMTGALTDRILHLSASSESITTADLPMRLPLTRPAEIRNILAVATIPFPLKQGVHPLEMADLSDVRMEVVMGRSTVQVKGKVLAGLATLTVASSSINTEDLPIEADLPKPIHLTNLHAAAEIKEQEVRLLHLTFDVFDGRVLARGRITMSDGSPPFNGAVAVHGIRIGQIFDSIRPDHAIAVSGTANMHLNVFGRGFLQADLNRALEGTGHVSVETGRLEGINLTHEVGTLFHMVGPSAENLKYTAFSAIGSDVLIKNGLVRTRNLHMDGQDFHVAGDGTVRFDTALNLGLNVQLSRPLSQRIAHDSTFGSLAMKNGRLVLPVTVTGTIRNPSLELDMNTLTGTVQTQLEEKVRTTVKGILDGTTKPQDLQQQGQELLNELFGR